MQPNSQNSLGDPSLKSHRSQYTEHHPTEPAAYSDNTYREVEYNEPEDISDTRGVRTSRQEIESSDEREIEEDEDLEEGDDAKTEEEEDDDVNSDIEDEHLEEENHNKTSLPDVEEDEEEEEEDAENDNESESDHKEEDNQQPLEQEYQSFGNPENSNKPTQPPATPEEKIDETKSKSKYTRPSHSGSPNRSRVHNYSMNTSQMNYTGLPNYLRDFSPSKVTVEEFEEYYEIFCINFLKRREEELEKKRRAQADLELSELQDRPHINANPNRHHIPLLERTPLLNARREKEIERMRREKEAKLAKELEELTFKPNINERSRGLASSSPNKSYYNSSSTYQGSGKKSPKKARKVGTFKPKINQTSRAIAKGVKERTTDDLVDRLYYQSNVIQNKKEELLKQLTPRFTPFLNKNTEKIHKKKNKDDASSFQGQKYEITDQDQQEYSDSEEQHHGHGGKSARSTRRFETESAYQTPRKPQPYDMEQANNEELLAILKQFNNMLKKKNENPINIQQLGTLMAGYADKRKSQREQAAKRDQEITTIEKNLKQVHGSLKNLREQSSENPSKVSLKEVRFDNDDEEDGKSHSTTGRMIKATYKTMEPTKKSPKKTKKFQTEKSETHDSEAPLSAKDISLYSSQAANHSSLSKSGALNKDNSRSSTPNLKSNSNLDNTTEKSMAKKKKKGDGESPKKKKKKASVNEDLENNQSQESPEKKKKKKKARSKDRGMNTDEIVLEEKGTQTSKKSKNNGQSNSDFSSQVVGSKNAIEGWYQSGQNDKDDDIIFVSNEGHRTDEERVLTQTNQPNETSFRSQSREDQDVNVNNFRSNHSQRVKYESEKSKRSSNNLGKSQGENYYSSKGRSQNPETGSKQGLSDKSYQSDNNRSKSKKGENARSQNHFTASEDDVAGAQDVEGGEYEEFEQEERPKASGHKKRSQAGSSSKKEKSRESREYKEDMSREQSQQQLGRNRAQTNEVKPQTQPSAQELSRRRGYSDPKAEKSPSNRTPSKNHQSKKPSGFRDSSAERNQKNNNTHNTHNTADKFRSISSISGDVQSDDPEKILSFNDEKGFTKSIDSSSNSHDDSETDKEEKEEKEGSGQIRNRVESISFSANNRAFNYRSNQSDQQQVPQSAQSKHENDSVKSKNSNERLKPEERRQGRNHRQVKYEVMSTETIQIQPNSTKRSSYGYAMDRNDRTLNSASSRGLKAIAQHIVKKFKAYDEQIKKSAKEYTISVSPPRSGSRSQSHSYSPDGSRNQTPEMKIQEPQVGEKKLFKSAHKAQLDSVDKSSKKHRMSLQGDSGSGKKVESVKRYTVGAR